MKKYILSILLLLPLGVHAEEQDSITKEMHGYFMVAKSAGMCGVFRQMAEFQKTTKMKGSKEFMIDFFNSEATRLGRSLKELLDNCVRISEQYNLMRKAFQFPEL